MGRVVLYRLPIVEAIADRIADDELSLRKVGDALGVSPQTIHNWLRGSATPTLDAASQRRFARWLAISPRKVLELFDLDLDDQVGELVVLAGQNGHQPAGAAADDAGDNGEQP